MRIISPTMSAMIPAATIQPQASCGRMRKPSMIWKMPLAMKEAATKTVRAKAPATGLI